MAFNTYNCHLKYNKRYEMETTGDNKRFLNFN